MISFCEGRYQATQDIYQWILRESYTGKNKDGEDKQQSRETYHGNLKQVCHYVLDRELGRCNSAEQIMVALDNAVKSMTEIAQ